MNSKNKHKPGYSREEKKLGYLFNTDASSNQMYIDREKLAPLDVFRLYNQSPQLFEDILSENELDYMIDWLLKNFYSRRPNKHGDHAHFSEKDMVFFLNHDYKKFLHLFWDHFKDVIPLYDHEVDFVSGNFFWAVRGYDLHHDFLFHQDYMNLLKNNPKVKYFIPYRSLVIPLFAMGIDDPPYNLEYTLMKEHVYGFGQTMGDVINNMLKQITDEVITYDTDETCLCCNKKTKELVPAISDNNEATHYYKLCKSCFKEKKLKYDLFDIEETTTSIFGTEITGRYKKLASRPKEFFYDIDSEDLTKSLKEFHFEDQIDGAKWSHIELGTLFGFREDATFRWRGGDIISQDANQLHISGNLDPSVRCKAGLMINIAKPRF